MIDTSKPVTNPALSAALEQLHRENTPENQNRVLDEVLMRAHLLAPVVYPKGESATPGNVQFQVIAAQDGRTFFPAFTDWSELRKLCGPRDQQTMVLTFDDYAAMLSAEDKVSGFVINPLGMPLTLEKTFVAQLAKEKKQRAGYSHQVIRKDTKVLLGDVTDWPQAMTDAVCLAVRELEEVSRLYLRLMSREGEAQPSYLIVVDYCGDQDKVFRTIADAARPHLQGRRVDLVPFENGLGQTAAKDQKPFFSRTK